MTTLEPRLLKKRLRLDKIREGIAWYNKTDALVWRGISPSKIWEYKETNTRLQKDLTKNQTLLGPGSYNVKPPKLWVNKRLCLSHNLKYSVIAVKAY